MEYKFQKEVPINIKVEQSSQLDMMKKYKERSSKIVLSLPTWFYSLSAHDEVHVPITGILRHS